LVIFKRNLAIFATTPSAPLTDQHALIELLTVVGCLGKKETMKNALAALKFLTVCTRLRRFDFDLARAGRGAFYFPLVGLVLGALVVWLDRFLQPYLGSEILSVVLVAVLAVMTGAIHFEGLQQTFDALLDGMVERPSGALGLLAILFVVVLKVRSLEITGETRSLALLLSPTFARWALVIFLYGAADRTDQAARPIAENVRAWHLVVTTLLTLTLAGFLIGRSALWIGLYLSLFALLSRSFLLRQNRTIRYGNFGALVELGETLAFILFSTF
jgi:adenosylcobinamide-GDP ribazoletransferase